MKFLTKTITLSCLTLALFLSACKKEELTAEQWGERAIAIRNQILALSANIPCNQKSSVTVQTIQLDCTAQFYPILSSDLKKYEKLKAAYLAYTSKQYKAWTSEGLIVEPCFEVLWAADQPIRLECKDDKVHLVTAENLPIEEAKTLITTTRTQVDNLIAALSCTSETGWTYARLINHQTISFEYIPYSATSNYKELQGKVALYNRLNIRILNAEQNGKGLTGGKTVEKVECLNGKPVIKFKD